MSYAHFPPVLQSYIVFCHKSSVMTQPTLERKMWTAWFLVLSHMCEAIKRCNPYNLLIRDILTLDFKSASAITESTISLNSRALNITLP